MRISGSTTQSYERLASMQKINSASDNPANSAISEKLENQATGLKQGTENTENMQNVVKTAEGSLEGVHDKLQRMRELSVKASNGALAKSDKQSIQDEIEQLKGSIDEQIQNTEFNTQQLLNGDFKNKQVASNPDGSGQQVSIEDASTSSLGIDGFDVTENFDIDKIDKAIEKVSSARSELGSEFNRMEYSADINRINRYNTISANSRIKDVNPAEEMTNLKKNQVLQQYEYFAQNEKANQQGNILNILS